MTVVPSVVPLSIPNSFHASLKSLPPNVATNVQVRFVPVPMVGAAAANLKSLCVLPDDAARSVSAAAGVPAVSPIPSRPLLAVNIGVPPVVADARSACHPALVITFP